MSILSELMKGKITWSQAAAQVEAWAEKIVAHDQGLTALTGALLSDVKQAASDAITTADSALAAHLLPAAAAAEAALDAALASATHGLSVPFSPFLNDGIDKIAQTVIAEANAWALKTKAALASPDGSGPLT